METITECQINLFSEILPSLEDIEKLSCFVHSSESNQIAFGKQVDENMSGTGHKASMAMGIGLFILGKDAEAVKRLEKAKDCKEKYVYLAFALRRMREFNEAIKNLQKALEYEADKLNITLEKAATYLYASNINAAAGELKTLGNFINVNAEYHYHLGRVQEAQGLYAEAANNYKTAVQLSPNNQKALFHLAYRCDLSGDEEAAINYYKQIASTAPVYVNALLNLAVHYEDINEFDKAEQCIDKVLKHHPNHQKAIMFKKDIESSKTMFYDEEKEKKKDRRMQILDTPISDFELSVRSRNCLKKMNIETIGDLLKITEMELLSYKNFGETSLREIKAILEPKGLRLGVALEEKPFPGPEAFNHSIAAEGNEGILNKSVDDLQLSVRARKCLQKLNINVIGELVRKTEAELLGVKNFGVTSLNEIKKAIENIGLSLRNLD